MYRLLIICLPLLFSSYTGQCLAGEAKMTEQFARKVISNSLEYIQERGESWRQSKHCHSCHRTTFTLWALNRAQEKGFEVNTEQLKTWNERGRKWESFTRGKDLEKEDPAKVLRNENAAVGQMLLGRPVKEQKGEWISLFRTRLVEGQNKGGFWNAGGQLPKQKRPKRETTETNTMWAMLALLDYEETDAKVEHTLKNARKWMGNKTKPVSTEWWVTKLLLERETGNGKAADGLLETLLTLQNKDGGWGWLTEEKSDAFGTGLVLYALAKEGICINNPQVRKAIQFLEKTQHKDGAWEVNGTKEQDRDEPAETAKYWGTTWAVIGLLEFLEDV